MRAASRWRSARRWRPQAFRHTATYDVAVASWMGANLVEASGDDAIFPQWLGATWERIGTLRYGENSHQPAALYDYAPGPAGITQAEQLHGKEMSYNNYTDGDAAYRAAYDFDEPCVAIIKHANPCGIAIGADVAQAHRKAHACDPVSAFGGVIATNRPGLGGDGRAGRRGVHRGDHRARLRRGRRGDPQPQEEHPHPGRAALHAPAAVAAADLRGAAAAGSDQLDAPGDDPTGWQLVAGEAVDAATLDDLAFAWRACRAVKSNAILLASEGASVGVGMGQVNRVDSCKLAVERAGERAQGAVAASDAFFPFADGPTILIEGGVKAIVEPGGSVRDDETIEACKAAGVALYFTGTRHFFH